MYRSELTEHALRETFLLVQIETPEGLVNVDEIASVPGVDGLYIGPGDMGVRMRLLPESERVSTDELMRRVSKACRKHGKAWGYFAATVDDLPKQLELGAQLVLWGFDLRLLKDAFTQASRELDEALKT
jgi:2-keto-3-deoxy-L-rhamnonate aldolase RhmA